MKDERFKGIASKHRDATVEENLKQFNEMKAGTPEGLRWCIRAKISVDDPNKALRDPVIYRCNPLPHHRTGYSSSPQIKKCRSRYFIVLVINGRSTQHMTSLAL